MFDWTIWLGIIILIATVALAFIYNWWTAKEEGD